LRDAIHNCFASLLRASLTASAAAKAEVGGVTSAAPAEHTADAEATWLLRSIDAMCRAYADAPFEIAPAVGGAVGWLLDTGKSGMLTRTEAFTRLVHALAVTGTVCFFSASPAESAESLWGSYVSALKERAAESIDDESARLQGAVDEALRLVARYGTQPLLPCAMLSTRSQADLSECVWLHLTEQCRSGILSWAPPRHRCVPAHRGAEPREHGGGIPRVAAQRRPD
jgi:hypothetical protein